jgi:hypothetical protein
VIGGELVIAPGGKLTDNSGVAEDEEEAPKIPYLANSTQSTAANVVKDFNALLILMRAQGLMDAVAPTITITTQPEEQSAAVNDTVELAVAGSSSDGRAVAYQWYSNTANSTVGATKITTGGTAATYAPVTTAAGTIYYYCVMSDAAGGATESVAPVTSSIVAVVVA